MLSQRSTKFVFNIKTIRITECPKYLDGILPPAYRQLVFYLKHPGTWGLYNSGTPENIRCKKSVCIEKDQESAE